MADLPQALVGVLRYGSIVHALLASVVAGVVCSTVGTFIALQGMPFPGDEPALA